MIKIKNVIVPTKGTGKYLEIKTLTFNLNPISGINLYWAIYSEEKFINDEEVEITSIGLMLLEGNLYMSKEIYDRWGTDDNFVIDWVIKELDLTKEIELIE